MKTRPEASWFPRAIAFALAFALAAAAVPARAGAGPSPQEREARRILDATGVQGGLVIHLGCGDGGLTAALHASDRYLVQGLDRDPAHVEKARATIESLGLYGDVTAARLDGRRLPYIDNLANLVVAEDLADTPMTEILRVLAPKGVAYVYDKETAVWVKRVKARPQQMDQWTHYLHDPQGTMVARDRIVGLPQRLQWVGGPKWLRNHDFMSSLNGLVSSGGRIFYLIDEGLRQHIYLPSRWTVEARDAFNGKILWRRPIERWFPQTWPFKSGPAYLPRRIVAEGDRLYVTLGIAAPLSVLDAATGETIRTYDQTEATEEIVLSDGVLYLLVDPSKQLFPYKHASSNRGKERDRVNHDFGWSVQSPPRSLMAVSAETGQVLWRGEHRVAPLTLAVRGEQVFFFDGERVAALDCGTGRRQWISDEAGQAAVPSTGYAPRLIAGDGVVILSTKKGRGGRLVGMSAETGEILWRTEQLSSGHWSPEDVFLINGVIWTAQTGKSQTSGTHFEAVDARTGAVVQDFTAHQIEAFFMHQRCYPGRATERYLLTSGTGTEYLELGRQQCELHHWLRGSCIYGVMPCNGLLYKPPDSCACFYQSKLEHFCALASGTRTFRRDAAAGNRLEKGPAYAEASSQSYGPAASTGQAWPAYRCDNARSGAAPTGVSAPLRTRWRTSVGGKLSTMTAAAGKLFVAAVDRHTLYALAADSGDRLWSFTAGGRVDSPPTIDRGLVLFGCADGWVYCLKASDGALAWRFRAAPAADQLVAYDQVESVWPLHGSVLVRDGQAYCLAGRNMFVDGGMRLVRLDCATGQVLSETVLDDKDPSTGRNLQTLMAGKSVPVANADILSCQGDRLYLRAQPLNLEGKRVDLHVAMQKERDQTGEGRHLFCPTGFLDDLWFHRSYWLYGKNAGEGHGEYPVPRSLTPAGRIMALDSSRVYAFFAENVGNNINPRTSYTLYAAERNVSGGGDSIAGTAASKGKRGQKGKPGAAKGGVPHIWELRNPGLLANAMILAGRSLLLAGPPDVADEEKTYDFVFGADDEIHRELARQEEAWRGKLGALLWVVSADSGNMVSEYKIPAIPVWDGMIAADGRLFLSLKDGTVLCMGGP